MRLASLTGRLLTTLGLTLTLSGIALADGGQREAPIEPMDRVAAEEAAAEAPLPPREEAEPTPIAKAMGRSLTACEQLRIDLHGQQRGYYDRKRDDRRAAYLKMRGGDPEAKYICIGTTCTPARQHQLHKRVMQWDHKSVKLQERINRGPVGSSDDCKIFHMSMMEQFMAGSRWHHPGRYPKRDRMQRDGGPRGPQADAPVDRRDPFEIEMESRLERARRNRGY